MPSGNTILSTAPAEGKAERGKRKVRNEEACAAESQKNELIKLLFGGQPQTLPRSSYLLLFLLFAFPSAGAVDKIVFPEGMQEVNFGGCSLTGTAELGYE